jgi:hypothetical protein
MTYLKFIFKQFLCDKNKKINIFTQITQNKFNYAFMRRILHFSFLFLLAGIVLKSQTVLIEDNFNDKDNFHDISQLLLWGDSTHPRSCFQLSDITDDDDLTYQAIHLTDEASPLSTYHLEVEGKPSLRTASCFDYELMSSVTRTETAITIEFDALWEKYGNIDGSYPEKFGEHGRIVIMLLDDYPLGGPQFGDLDSVHLETPFGRPKYNLRIRNGSPVDESNPDYDNFSPILMLYGGGHDINGEIEKNGDSTTWYPGFSAQAGGGSPGQPGDSDYPYVATKKAEKPWYWVSISEWLHYTWVIEPEQLRVYVRPSWKDASEDSLISTMSIPKDMYGDDYIIEKMNDVHGSSITSLPSYYKWFDTFSAIRVYFRSYDGNISYMANLKVTEDEYICTAVPHASSALALSAYPNPSTDGIFYFSEPIKELRIYNLAGQLVAINTTGHINHVDLSSQVSGIYIYHAVLQDGTTQSGKLSKQ